MLTKSGVGCVLAAIIAVTGAWLWRYEELLIVGACLIAAVAVALIRTRILGALTVERYLRSPRVARGEKIRLMYRVVNKSRRRSPKVTLTDQLDTATLRVVVPSIAGHDRGEVHAELLTTRRGEFVVGPNRFEQVDALGLAVGHRLAARDGIVIIHPRVYALDGPYGMMHSADNDASIRTATGDPLSGLVSLREYVDGDDPRLIHWPTTARHNTLMVREHVELRRPEFTVVVDTAASAASAADFEEIVDVAASVAIDGLRKGITVRLRTTNRKYLGYISGLSTRLQVLGFLTPIQQSAVADTASVFELFRRGGDQGRIVLVTGPTGPSSATHNPERELLVKVGQGATAGPGVHLATQTAIEFSQRWRP